MIEAAKAFWDMARIVIFESDFGKQLTPILILIAIIWIIFIGIKKAFNK